MNADRTRPALAALDILVVEDNEGLRMLLARVLEAAGARLVRVAANATDALRLARERRPQLLLTDMYMPGMSGAALIARLRAEGYAPDAVLLMSGAGDDLDPAACAAADAVLTKPISPKLLLARIEAAVAQRAA